MSFQDLAKRKYDLMKNNNKTFSNSIFRGFKLKCPACGEGKLFSKFLKVRDHCSHCHQELSHFRADDAPPYLTIFIIVHLVVPFFLALDRFYNLSIPFLLVLSLPITLILTLATMPFVKGGVLGVLYQLEKREKDSRKSDI
tara:strand:+ start:4689 stop:5111 length:423 start_codon:yes stop_codon:yes gene_type:complete